MPALLIKTDVSQDELRRLASREDDARVATAAPRHSRSQRRLLALANTLVGMPRAVAAKAAGIDGQTLRDWVIWYNRRGVQALEDAWGRGRPCRQSEGEQATLKAMGPRAGAPGPAVLPLCR